MSLQAHHLDHVIYELARPKHAHRRADRLDLGAEPKQRGHGCLRHSRHPGGVGEDREEVGFRFTRVGVERLDGHVADLPRGHRDDAPEAQGVLRVEAEAHVGDDVFDLPAFPEPDAADEAVRDTAPGEHVFEGA